MRIAYVFDYGDELRHDLEVLRAGEPDSRSLYPVVLERNGTPPPQYPLLDDESDDGSDAEADEGDEIGHEQAAAGAEPPAPARLPLSPELERAAAAAVELEKCWDALVATLDGVDGTPPPSPAGPAALEQIRAILDATPDLERARTLAQAVYDRHGFDFTATLREVLSILASQHPADAGLLPVAERWAALTGDLDDLVRVANLVRSAGNAARAVDLLASFKEPPHEANRKLFALCTFLVAAGRPAEAEAHLRGLLARRWLSGSARTQARQELTALLRSSGRAEEADQLDRVARAQRNQLASEEAGTLKRQAPKVSPNDRCPGGSGKKYKRCCGQ
jgi:hypothetical protein